MRVRMDDALRQQLNGIAFLLAVAAAASLAAVVLEYGTEGILLTLVLSVGILIGATAVAAMS